MAFKFAVKTLRLLKPTKLSRTCVRHHNMEGQFMKSPIVMLSQEVTDVLYIEGFSNIGFTMSNKVQVDGPEDITVESLSLFTLLVPKLDILVLGYGDAGVVVNPTVLKYLRNKYIQLEVLPTEHACSTFNFLNAEKRCVAGAMIPPTLDGISMSEDDIIDTALSKSLKHDMVLFKDGPDFRTKDFELPEEVEEKIGIIERRKLQMKKKDDDKMD